ncbi:hypothetical protein AURDEDRAFT_144223 [Auricularia subglabra TFB-10046 SS5]|nr:hypothetical protein AURDEDRAFT_144223 [Auricularia subglabra TFB-10046 SS5]
MSRPLCRFYQENKCMNGSRCPYRHDRDTRTVPSCVPGKSRPSRGSKTPCVFWSAGTCTKGKNCEFSHATPQSTSSGPPHASQPLCTYFLQGRCAAGQGCKFLHDPAGLMPTSKPPRSSEPSFPAPVSPTGHVPCRYFAAGRCTTVQCPFLHAAPPPAAVVIQRPPDPAPVQVPADPPSWAPVPPDQSEPPHEDEWQDWRPIAGTHVRVRYGDGGAVQEVMTAFDSTKLVLANLPFDASEEDVRRLVSSFGELHDVTVFAGDALTGKTTALVEFDSCAAASNAAAALSDMHVSCSSGSRSVITASVRPRAGERGAATLRSNSVRLAFHAPARVAYAHYDDIRRAKQEAGRLSGLRFNDRAVTAVFQKPTAGQFESFTVIIGNLPIDAKSEHVTRFARSRHVDLMPVSYDEYTGLRGLRDALQRFGRLESLESQPALPGAPKLKALARFASAEAAEEATKALNRKPQPYLGKSPLWIQRIFSIKYPVPRAVYLALKDEVGLLELDQSADETAAKIRVYDKDADKNEIDPVTLRVYCDEPKPLGKLKMAVEQLLAGERWVDGKGVAIWDDCLLDSPGDELLAKVNATGKAIARCDARRRCVLLYGKMEHRNALSKQLERGLEKLKAKRGVLPLDKKTTRRLVTGGLARVQAFYGRENVTYNVRARTLEVRAEDVDLDTVRQLVNDPGSVAQDEPEGDVECPICFCGVTKPTTLACGHSYCSGCIQHYMSSAASGDTFPIRCLAGDGQCSVPVAARDLARLMKSGDQDKLSHASFLAYTRARPAEFKYCPTADCPELYRPAGAGTLLRCPSCLAGICPACHSEFHDGLSCEIHREMRDGRGGDESFRLWREKNFVQECPGCGTLLDKYDGCNHVTCVVCKTHMCWECLGVFASNEIYEHMRIAHGNIYS